MIDWARLDELCDDLGAETVLELVDLFLAESDEIVQRMAPGRAPQALADEFHALKGAAANLGLTDVARMCNAAEDAARHPEAEAGDMARRVTQIRDAYGAARQALLDGVPQRYDAVRGGQASGM